MLRGRRRASLETQAGAKRGRGLWMQASGLKFGVKWETPPLPILAEPVNLKAVKSI